VVGLSNGANLAASLLLRGGRSGHYGIARRDNLSPSEHLLSASHGDSPALEM
jgi:hypothetical protein